MKSSELLSRIENVQQNFKMIDNIFRCMPMYWKGESQQAIQELYLNINKDVFEVVEYIDLLKDKIGGNNIKKLPGDIL